MDATMATFRYSVRELLRRLPVSIGIHWPGERLVLVAPCLVVRGRPEAIDPFDDTARAPARRRPYWELPSPPTAGFLGATEARVIHEDRTTPVTVLRGIAFLLGLLGAVMLPFTDGLAVPIGFLLVAATLWLAARGVELFALGRRAVSFDRIFFTDTDSRRLDAVMDDGSVIRFQISDPIAYHSLATLMSGGEAASAA
jgi:hypothetical protein